MFIPFKEMVSTSRVWVYQADRFLSAQDVFTIEEWCQSFTEQWVAHGKQLKSSYKIFYAKFLVLCVDENFEQVSGCSIDASVGLVGTLEKELEINFLDRSRVCFLVNDEIFESAISDVKNNIQSGKIQSSTLIFNNLVLDLDALNKNWLEKAKDSWLKRHFK